MNNSIFPIIMAGGKGERFWPYSNSKHPKQLLPLVSQKTMLEDTLELLQQLNINNPIHIIASQNLLQPIQNLIGSNPNIFVIGEPQGKNTAAAIALACKMIHQINPQGVMAVFTADHFIRPINDFKTAVEVAVNLAQTQTGLVTFGIESSRPDTGFGYIEVSDSLPNQLNLKQFKVKKFCEKPTLSKAQEYLDSGNFFWNSGMFVWKIDYLWSLFQELLPDTYTAFETLTTTDTQSPIFLSQLQSIYQTIPNISIDYGIMEKAPKVFVVIPKFKWDDIGSWSSLERLNQADNKGNVNIGEVVALESENCLHFAENGGAVASYGVKDLLVVQCQGVTVVTHKSKIAELKKLVEQAKIKFSPSTATQLF